MPDPAPQGQECKRRPICDDTVSRLDWCDYCKRTYDRDPIPADVTPRDQERAQEKVGPCFLGGDCKGPDSAWACCKRHHAIATGIAEQRERDAQEVEDFDPAELAPCCDHSLRAKAAAIRRGDA